MAIFKSNKTQIAGLTADLAALNLADSNEITARLAADAAELARAEAAELKLTQDLATEAAAARAAELKLTQDLAAEAVTARDAELVLTNHLTVEVSRALAAEAALQLEIDNLINNTDGVALNSLAEVVTAFQAADGTINGAITTLAGAAGSNLTAEHDRAVAAELVLTTAVASEATAARAAELVLTNALAAEIAKIAVDEAAQTAALQAFTTEAVRVGGAVDKTEMVTVSADKIVLSFAPKFGLNSIGNFNSVMLFDPSGVTYQAQVSQDATDSTGKTFIVAVDETGQWNTKQVMIQYSYTAV